MDEKNESTIGSAMLNKYWTYCLNVRVCKHDKWIFIITIRLWHTIVTGNTMLVNYIISPVFIYPLLNSVNVCS